MSVARQPFVEGAREEAHALRGRPDERVREEAKPPSVDHEFSLQKVRLCEEAQPPTVDQKFNLQKIRLREEANTVDSTRR